MEELVGLERVRRWCDDRIPEAARERVRLILEDGAIVELRAPMIREAHDRWLRREVARLRWSGASETWSLEWHDGMRWRRYSKLLPARDVEPLLREIARDSCGLFWPRGRSSSGGEERSADVALT